MLGLLEDSPSFFTADLDSVKGNIDNVLNSLVTGAPIEGGGQSSEPSSNGFSKSGTGEWKFIWDNPSDIFKLFLGENIDLVHYDMPALSFNFNWDKFFRIWVRLELVWGVSLGRPLI